MNRRCEIQRTVRYYRLKTRHIISRSGVSALVRKALVKAARTAYRTTCSLWFVKDLHDQFGAVMPQLRITVNYLVKDKARAIDWLREHHREFPWMFFHREIEAACRNGHIFTVIEFEGNIIGYLKVGMDNVYIHDFDRIVRFPSGTAIVYDTFLLPEYRGKQVALYALLKTMEFLADKGYSKLWCHIEKWNSASLGLFRKAGFREKCTIRFSRILTLPLFIRDGYRPFSRWESLFATQ